MPGTDLTKHSVQGAFDQQTAEKCGQPIAAFFRLVRNFPSATRARGPGKFSHLDEALALLKPGGIYVIDDLLPQPNWPEGHAPKVSMLVDDIERRVEFTTVRLAWASGLMLVVRRT